MKALTPSITVWCGSHDSVVTFGPFISWKMYFRKLFLFYRITNIDFIIHWIPFSFTGFLASRLLYAWSQEVSNGPHKPSLCMVVRPGWGLCGWPQALRLARRGRASQLLRCSGAEGSSQTQTVVFIWHACEVTSVVSNSLWPYGPQPARLLCPWDSPGKSTGVGCHLSFSKGSFWPRDWTRVFYVSCTGRWVLYHSHHLETLCLFHWVLVQEESWE